MGFCCDLEVDVNGEGLFMVDKEVLSCYSGKLGKLFGKKASTRNLKVIFHDFPGGAEIFELVARFCYNNGAIEISPGKITVLHCAATFMEMSRAVSGTDNLIEQTEKLLEQISSWTMSDLLLVLKQSRDLPVDVNTCRAIQKCLDALVGRLAVTTETSSRPSTSSPDSSGFRMSCDSRSTESMKTSCSRAATWWFDDISVLDQVLVEKVINSMVLRSFDHGIISKFLFHYQKSKFASIPPAEKCRILEMVINSLYSLDRSSIPYRNLMGILRISLNLNISKSCRSRLESLIGTRLDEATLDNLLVPSPLGVNYLYDVNLVLRFVKSFLSGMPPKSLIDRVTRVAHLLDLYLAEVAPDPCLKPSKFIGLATVLPDYSRDSYDDMYHAIDMYLEVHTDLSEEETFKICSALNYEKLSQEACVHLSKNSKFPSRSAVQALLSQQSKLKSLLQDASYPQSCSSSPEFGKNDSPSDQIVLYAGKMNVTSENENLRKHIQGMQWRVTELEKACQKMQVQISKITKSKPSSNSSPRSLPKLCS
ncbi:hypothetical protein RND81_11G178100 [Saponaria officinalis]|uniref:Phototropic-responsive NPH3 family protein n=1 Tax=Saponaria officinalis TaxID=3572 RepID=A0AAW1HQ68_SAPOF